MQAVYAKGKIQMLATLNQLLCILIYISDNTCLNELCMNKTLT